MTSISNPPPSPSQQSCLVLEAAVAARLVRADIIPAPLLQWLASPMGAEPCVGAELNPLCDARLTASLNEIIQPVRAECTQAEQQRTQYAAEWLAVVCRCAANHYSQLKLGIGPRLLAASLLPLYRCLATGDLTEGLRQSRSRLAEMLSLLALCHELGNDLVELLDVRNRHMDSPDVVLAAQFELNLGLVAELLCELALDFEPTSQQFSTESTERLQGIDAAQSRASHPEWAAPGVLWKLSGELISKKSELVLPRDWIDTHVPWNNVADHWLKLDSLLNGMGANRTANSRVTGSEKSSPPTQVPQRPAEFAATLSLACSPQQEFEEFTTTDATSASKLGAIQAAEIEFENEFEIESDEQSTLAAIAEIAAMVQSREAGSSTSQLAEELPGTRREFDKSPEASHSGPLPLETPAVPAPTVAEPVLPKVLIAEIRSHNDPIFVNVIRRQIGKCRAEDRAVSLVSMVVLPEDENDRHEIHENGLTLWQQKMVNWLADHPQVIEPHAFLTSDGELLLCLLDLERNETTSLVRHGLVEVLTGRHIDESQGNMLAKVNVPARYHAGIASTSSPGARFSPEQLIEPTIRCLSAASRHGKASIKSIEVY